MRACAVLGVLAIVVLLAWLRRRRRHRRPQAEPSAPEVTEKHKFRFRGLRTAGARASFNDRSQRPERNAQNAAASHSVADVTLLAMNALETRPQEAEQHAQSRSRAAASAPWTHGTGSISSIGVTRVDPVSGRVLHGAPQTESAALAATLQRLRREGKTLLGRYQLLGAEERRAGGQVRLRLESRSEARLCGEHMHVHACSAMRRPSLVEPLR